MPFLQNICKLNPVNERAGTINVALTVQYVQVERCSGVYRSVSTGGYVHWGRLCARTLPVCSICIAAQAVLIVCAGEEELLLCSETVLQTSSNDILSPSPLPPRATSLPNLAPSSMPRTPTQSTVGETAASPQGAKEDRPTASEVSAVSYQSAQKTLQQARIGRTDYPVLVEESVPSPSAGKEGGILGSGLAGERSAWKGKKSMPKVKRFLACTISLPATKRLKMKQSQADSASTELMDTGQIT